LDTKPAIAKRIDRHNQIHLLSAIGYPRRESSDGFLTNQNKTPGRFSIQLEKAA
jgi:hypothetical protein